MATVAPHPYYEFHPAGITIDSFEGVTEMYRNALPGIVSLHKSAKQLNVWFNETSCCAEYEFTFPLPSGALHRAQFFAILDYEGELLRGERCYSDQELGILHTKLLGEDLLNVPGVHGPKDGDIPRT